MKDKIKPTYGYAVLIDMRRNMNDSLKENIHYCFTWDNKHPEDEIQKSEMVFAIYPTKKQATEDLHFRGDGVIKRIILK